MRRTRAAEGTLTPGHQTTDSRKPCPHPLEAGATCGEPPSPLSATGRCEVHRRVLVMEGEALGFFLFAPDPVDEWEVQ